MEQYFFGPYFSTCWKNNLFLTRLATKAYAAKGNFKFENQLKIQNRKKF